jgi:hypothetical protein
MKKFMFKVLAIIAFMMALLIFGDKGDLFPIVLVMMLLFILASACGIGRVLVEGNEQKALPGIQKFLFELHDRNITHNETLVELITYNYAVSESKAHQCLRTFHKALAARDDIKKERAQ